MAARLSRIRALFFLPGLFFLFCPAAAERCSGYIMPAEQLLDFMARSFSGFQTLAVTQSTLRIQDDQERVFTEQVLTRSPDLFYLKTLDQRMERPDPPDMSYRQLLMANTGRRIEQLLAGMGIRLDTVSLTRLDGVISYRIGEKRPDGPGLLIEKERFLPLLLIYRPPNALPGDLLTVRFRDYREQDKGWFPFEITCATDGGIEEQYTALTVLSNHPVDSAGLRPFNPQPGAGRPGEESLDVNDERLQKVIKAFEEKYP